jgi:hypothetical protein
VLRRVSAWRETLWWGAQGHFGPTFDESSYCRHPANDDSDLTDARFGLTDGCYRTSAIPAPTGPGFRIFTRRMRTRSSGTSRADR